MEEIKEIAVVKAQVTKAEQALSSLAIESAEDLTKAVEVRSKIYKVGKLITGEKEKATKPLNESLKKIRSWFKPLEERCEVALEDIDSRILAYQKKIDDEAKQAEDVINDKLASGDMMEKTAEKKLAKIERVENTVSSSKGAVQFRTNKKVVIEERELIPEKYWVIDEVLVRKEALSGVVIPGVSIVEEKILANSR